MKAPSVRDFGRLAAILTLVFALAGMTGISCRSTSSPKQENTVTLVLDAVPLLLKADSVSASTIWATVLESGRPVKDSTMVAFATSQGQVTPQALTRDGLAQADFHSLGVTGVASIVAQVLGVRDTVVVTIY